MKTKFLISMICFTTFLNFLFYPLAWAEAALPAPTILGPVFVNSQRIKGTYPEPDPQQNPVWITIVLERDGGWGRVRVIVAEGLGQNGGFDFAVGEGNPAWGSTDAARLKAGDEMIAWYATMGHPLEHSLHSHAIIVQGQMMILKIPKDDFSGRPQRIPGR